MKTILLFGMPRSGTTWIGKIFDSHIKTLYCHEPDSWEKLKNMPLLIENDDAEQYVEFATNYLKELPKNRDVRVTSKLPLFPKKYMSFIRYRFYWLSVYFLSVLSKLNVKLDLPTYQRTSEKSQEEAVVVWKSIESLGRLPVFSNTEDCQAAVHIVRNPAGYIASFLSGEKKKVFQSSQPIAEDYELFGILLNTQIGKSYGLTIEALKQLSPVERLSFIWCVYNDLAYQTTSQQKNYVLLKYEDLCANPLEMTRKTFNQCGLEWCKQTENFLGESVSKNSDSYYSVYKDPMVSAYKWRKTLSEDDIAKIRNFVQRSPVGKLYLDELK